jgi:hypothetical protein
MANIQKKITPIMELVRYKDGVIVEFPPFAEGQPFIARIRRPSLLALVKSGKIPNQLVAAANSLFNGSALPVDKEGKSNMEQFYGILDNVAEAAFLEPTYKEIKDAGIELADDQYIFLFNYTQTGVENLKSFRKK